jgi:hypothetical protein
LSQKVPQHCSVQFSQSILYIVIACNVVKVILMALILWLLNQDTIVTIGDAIKSFLQTPDHTTEDCCLMSSRNINEIWAVPRIRSSEIFQPKHREPWFGAMSRKRWAVFLLLYAPKWPLNLTMWTDQLGVSPQLRLRVSLRSKLSLKKTSSAQSTSVSLKSQTSLLVFHSRSDVPIV